VLSDGGLENRNMELVDEESNILVWKTVAKTHIRDQDIDGMAILKCLLRIYGMKLWTGLVQDKAQSQALVNSHEPWRS